MKKLVIFIICLNIQLISFAQIFSNIDEISPFHGDFAAIKKGDLWAIINKNGEKVIDFRNDLVLSEIANKENQSEISLYPIVEDGRCLIKKMIDGNYYFGYINENGEEVIAPTYLNATNFSNGFAIIVKYSKDSIGYNKIFKKNLIAHKLEEYIIDTQGNLVKYLYNGRNYIEGKTDITIQSKFLAPHLIAVKDENNKWKIYNF